jgi:hypothetical protein
LRNKASQPLHLHSINEFEFRNAVRLLVFRGKITVSQKHARVAAYEADKVDGVLVVCNLDANDILVEAEILSAAHSEQGGHRAYDILHVAASKLLGATEFWSFDGKQRALAAAERMAVGP